MANRSTNSRIALLRMVTMTTRTAAAWLCMLTVLSLHNASMMSTFGGKSSRNSSTGMNTSNWYSVSWAWPHGRCPIEPTNLGSLV